MRTFWKLLFLALCAILLLTAATMQNGSGGFRNIAEILNPAGYTIRDETTLTTTTVTQQTIDSITLDDDSVYHATAIVKAFEDGVNRASYNLEVTAYRDGGNATLQGGVSSLHTSESEAAWDATFTVSGNDLHISVTGEAATTIGWTATMIHSSGGV